MASVQDRLKLKRETCDTWSTREQLCLASSVLKSGDQNWISVSRSLRPFAEKEALRPPDWFSQKSCAIQYAILLENADTPKRKKRESGETTGESIVRRLTQERITELGQILAFQRDEYQQLKNEVNLLKSGNISDEKLQKMWQAIEQEEREAEQKARAHSAWLAKRQQKNEPQGSRKSLEAPAEAPELQELQPDTEEDRKSRGGRSPLLTSLLKSPSPTTQMQNPASTATSTSPTIASLLGANTKTTTPQISTAASPQLHHFITSTLAPSVPERPSAGAPTLSMLLELPSNLPRGSIANMQTSQSSLTESPRTKITNPVNTSITTAIPGGESVENIIEQIDDVIGKDTMPEVIDKDEINEIIGDIEELIKEEITKSPKTSDTSGIVETIPVSVEPKVVRDMDETASETSGNEVIGEIDQSSSSIAEIIGTAVEEVKGVQGDAEVPEEVKSAEGSSMAVDEVKEDVEGVEDEKTEVNEDKNEEKMEEDTNEEKNDAEEAPDVPKPDHKSPEPDPEPKDDDKVEEDDKNQKTEEKIPEKEEEVTEDKSEEDKPRDEDDKSGIDEEKCDETDEKKETNDDNDEPPEAPEDKQSEKDNEDKSESKESPKSEEKSDSVEEPPGDEKNEAPEGEDTPEIKESDPDPKSPDKEKEDDSKESEDEFKDCMEHQDDSKSSGDSNEKIEDLGEEKSKVAEEESPKTDVDEELEPPVLPNELEELPLDKKEKEEEEEVKSEDKNEVKDLEIDGKADEGCDSVKEEPMDEKSEEKSEENDLKEDIKKEDIEMKKEEVSAADDTDVEEEESSLAKLPAGRAIKTYSKKQNAVVDSEPETETSDTAEYKIWKKSILLHYSRLATHKYASLFLRPITEDQAPGYQSLVFRSMDLSTIKKNIDNGRIRTNMEFQRDVMLMFQNAVMYNKSDSFVYQMAVKMQEECLQSMQILVEATGEGAFRRETRTAASSSSETSDSSIIKRKRSLVTPIPHDTDSPRMKKRRKSEND